MTEGFPGLPEGQDQDRAVPGDPEDSSLEVLIGDEAAAQTWLRDSSVA